MKKNKIPEISNPLKKNKKAILEAIKTNHYSLEWVDDSLKKDREFILKVVKLNGLELEFADDSLKKDKEIVLEAIKASSVNTRVSEIIDKSLMKDSDVLAMIALIGKKK